MTYVTVADVRLQGVPDSIVDDRIDDAIKTWQSFIERETRQWFEEREVTINIDGNDSPILFLPVPIITMESVYMNNDMDNVVDADRYRVFNSRTAPDDRRNPRLQFITSSQTIYDSPAIRGPMPTFLKGMNQRLVGTFGFVDDDVDEDDNPILVTPPMIKRALLKLVIKQLAAEGTGSMWEAASSAQPASTRITSETTDGHSISYDAARVTATRAGSNSITGDAEVDRILTLFKGPPAMSVPGSLTIHFG